MLDPESDSGEKRDQDCRLNQENKRATFKRELWVTALRVSKNGMSVPSRDQ